MSDFSYAPPTVHAERQHATLAGEANEARRGPRRARPMGKTVHTTECNVKDTKEERATPTHPTHSARIPRKPTTRAHREQRDLSWRGAERLVDRPTFFGSSI